MSVSVWVLTVSLERRRMLPLVVCSSTAVPPPFILPSRWRRDFSVTSKLSSDPTLMPPLVTEAATVAFAFSGSISVTLPLVVSSEIFSEPTDAMSIETEPLVVSPSTPPVRLVPLTAPLVVCATTLPDSALTVT